MSNAGLKEQAQKCLMNNYGVREVALVEGRGARAWDADGNEYLDFLSGIGVNNLGHCHPDVVNAVQEQAAKLIHCSNGMLIGPQIELGEFLCEELKMDRAMFANSGTEVTEGAIKLARLASRQKYPDKPSRHKIMVFKGSFHGRSYGSMSATWSPKVRENYDPFLPGFVFAEFNDPEDVSAKWDDDICAVMVETVQGEGGIRPAAPEFLRALRQRCTDNDAAFICDEVQCGMGRSGKKMAYMHAEVEPDILPLAKALGGGVPIGALLARGEYAETFTKGRHGTTFGGNPLACAAALAASKNLFREEFLKDVGRKACDLWGKMEEIVKDFPEVCSNVRGVGMMLGLVMKEEALEVIALARKQGLILNVTAGNVVRLLPPLVVEREHCDAVVDALEAILT